MDWPALMRLGLGHLRLLPAQFWDLTPHELMVMLGVGSTSATMTRAGLADLERRLDQQMKGAQDDIAK